MRHKLRDDGRVIFEVPNFSGFYHYHLVYFSEIFVRRLSRDLGFDVIKESVDGSVLRVCLQKSSRFSNQGQTVKNVPIEFLLKRIKDKITENINDIERIKQHFEAADRIFWWGTGSTSIIALSALGESICRNKRFVFVDNDKERNGLVLPLPFLMDFPIEMPQEACPKMQSSDLLVIASSFSSEILSQIKEMNCLIPRNVVSSIRVP